MNKVQYAGECLNLEQLVLLADDEIYEEKSREQFLGHLQECPNCRRGYLKVQTTFDTIAQVSFPQTAAPQNLVQETLYLGRMITKPLVEGTETLRIAHLLPNLPTQTESVLRGNSPSDSEDLVFKTDSCHIRIQTFPATKDGGEILGHIYPLEGYEISLESAELIGRSGLPKLPVSVHNSRSLEATYSEPGSYTLLLRTENYVILCRNLRLP